MRIRLSLTVILGLLALALTACGGEDPKAAPGSADAPLAGTPQGESTTAGRVNEGSAAAGKTDATERAETPGYQDLLAQQSAKPAERFTPCNLVRLGEARSILGVALQPPLEAPQGPTCIYRAQRGDDAVTLAVESRSLADLRSTLRKPERVVVEGRNGLCDDRGRGRLWVSLADGRVLSVGAGCDVAERFAATAVRRLDA